MDAELNIWICLCEFKSLWWKVDFLSTLKIISKFHSDKADHCFYVMWIHRCRKKSNCVLQLLSADSNDGKETRNLVYALFLHTLHFLIMVYHMLSKTDIHSKEEAARNIYFVWVRGQFWLPGQVPVVYLVRFWKLFAFSLFFGLEATRMIRD